MFGHEHRHGRSMMTWEDAEKAVREAEAAWALAEQRTREASAAVAEYANRVPAEEEGS